MQEELIGKLEQKYPGIALKHVQTSMRNDAYRVMKTFTEMASNTITAMDVQKTKKLLNDAFELWSDGCYEVKNAISNEFLYTISILMDSRPEINKNLMPLMCNEFKEELRKLHYTSLP